MRCNRVSIRSQANLAACSVYVGKIDAARSIYRELLATESTPPAQSLRVVTPCTRETDDAHVNEMLELLNDSKGPAERNVYLYYALGQGARGPRTLGRGIRILQTRRATRPKPSATTTSRPTSTSSTRSSRSARLTGCRMPAATSRLDTVPIFVTGLPRTGTTLTERILSSHSERPAASASRSFCSRP